MNTFKHQTSSSACSFWDRLRCFLKKIYLYLQKHWFAVTLISISVLRFVYTFNLPSFYIRNLNYDDGLMVRGLHFLQKGEYFGPYDNLTLIKSQLFPIILYLIKFCHLNYCHGFSLFYIAACLFLTLSLKDVIKNKKYLLLIYLLLLFNPASFSQDLFQRLYRNSLSMTEFIFFFACVVRVLFAKSHRLLNYSLLGLSLSLLFLTREDNLWVYPLLFFIFVYSFCQNKNLKTIFLNLLPLVILIGSLHLVSFINYRYYGIYTYNEIKKSHFHDTYKKILQIKDDVKIDQVAIPKSTLYLLAEKAAAFHLNKHDIDMFYDFMVEENEEITNGNLIWYLRSLVFRLNRFSSASESEAYYQQLGVELDELFANHTLTKEFIMPSIMMNVPTLNTLKQIPKNLLEAIIYSTTYRNIKTMTDTQEYTFDEDIKAYYLIYNDYHYTVNITEKNAHRFEIIRVFYQSFTLIFSLIAFIIYLTNITQFDQKSILSHLLLICYCLIIGGLAYTHATSFHAIRPLYFGNVYLIQSLFILINLSRVTAGNKKPKSE